MNLVDLLIQVLNFIPQCFVVFSVLRSLHILLLHGTCFLMFFFKISCCFSVVARIQKYNWLLNTSYVATLDYTLLVPLLISICRLFWTFYTLKYYPLRKVLSLPFQHFPTNNFLFLTLLYWLFPQEQWWIADNLSHSHSWGESINNSPLEMMLAVFFVNTLHCYYALSINVFCKCSFFP